MMFCPCRARQYRRHWLIIDARGTAAATQGTRDDTKSSLLYINISLLQA